MTQRRALSRVLSRRCHRHFNQILLGASGMAAALAVAQTNPAPTSAPAPAPVPVPYQDRQIESLSAQPDESWLHTPSVREGWPRMLRLESRLSHNAAQSSEGRTDLNQAGFSLYGLLETPAHGVLSADVGVTDAQRYTFTLRQRALPMDGGWLVHNELGVTSSATTELTQAPSRIHLPGRLILGVAHAWQHPDLTLALSTGQPGNTQSNPVGAFERQPGRLDGAAAQWQGDAWSASLRHAAAYGLPFEASGSGATTSATTNTRSPANAQQVTLRRSPRPGESWQLNVLRSATEPRQRWGWWVDGEHPQGAWNHAWGLYCLAPELSWAGQALASDVSGLYLRSAWQTRQWSAQAQADGLRSLSAPSRSGSLLSAQVVWRYSQRFSSGVGGSVRNYQGQAATWYSDMRWLSDWGSSSLRWSSSHDLGSIHQRSLSFNQDWLNLPGITLATGLSLSREQRLGLAPVQQWGISALLGLPLGANSQLNASVLSSQGQAGNANNSLNLGLNWRWRARWQLEANMAYAHTRSSASASLDPLAPPVTLSSVNQGRQVLLTLRYEDMAGTRVAPLGGSPQSGGARISGVVFLDANQDGHQDAAERGAANVTVYLDQRYTTRTDAQGRFEFPFVVAGPHALTLLNETLPLPWTTVGKPPIRLDLRVREDASVSIAAISE